MRLDRVPVASLDRAGQLEAVVDRSAHQGHERLRRRARGAEELGRDAVERDEVVGRDRGARVIQRTRVVGKLERLEPERAREPESFFECVLRLRGYRCEGTVQLLRAAGPREGLERMKRKPAFVRRHVGYQPPSKTAIHRT